MIEDYTLSHGTHATPQDGRCAMEWVSHLAGEPHSDEPTCVSPVLRAICVTLNDGLPDEPRQRLRPYLARTIGTAGDGLDEARGWLALDWLVRVYAPAWLSLAGCEPQSAQLRRAPAVVDGRSLRETIGVLDEARRAARSRRARVFAAGADPLTAWAAARRGARAGREAAWTCAGAATWAAARVGVGDDAGERVRALVRTIAGDAAACAVRGAPADDICGAPSGRAARRAALRPTLEALADSALALLDRMLITETVTLPTGCAPRATPAPATTPGAVCSAAPRAVPAPA